MQRRDAAIIFWSVAGLYAITRGVVGVTAAFYVGAYLDGASVMSSSGRLSALLLAIASDLPALALIVGGAIVLLRRFQLADWTFGPEPTTRGHGDKLEPDPPGTDLERTPGQVRALDLCALCVAAIGILTIVISFKDLEHELGEWVRQSPGPKVPDLALNLLDFALGWSLLLRRQRIAGWILGHRLTGSEGEAARLQTAGLALFGLFLILWYLPTVAVFAVSTFQSASPQRYLVKNASQYLLYPLFGGGIGLALFLGKVGAQQAWRALRPMSTDETGRSGKSDGSGGGDDSGEDGPTSTPTT